MLIVVIIVVSQKISDQLLSFYGISAFRESLFLTTGILCSRWSYYLHFADEELEAHEVSALPKAIG